MINKDGTSEIHPVMRSASIFGASSVPPNGVFPRRYHGTAEFGAVTTLLGMGASTGSDMVQLSVGMLHLLSEEGAPWTGQPWLDKRNSTSYLLLMGNIFTALALGLDFTIKRFHTLKPASIPGGVFEWQDFWRRIRKVSLTAHAGAAELEAADELGNYIIRVASSSSPTPGSQRPPTSRIQDRRSVGPQESVPETRASKAGNIGGLEDDVRYFDRPKDEASLEAEKASRSFLRDFYGGNLSFGSKKTSTTDPLYRFVRTYSDGSATAEVDFVQDGFSPFDAQRKAARLLVDKDGTIDSFDRALEARGCSKGARDRFKVEATRLIDNVEVEPIEPGFFVMAPNWGTLQRDLFMQANAVLQEEEAPGAGTFVPLGKKRARVLRQTDPPLVLNLLLPKDINVLAMEDDEESDSEGVDAEEDAVMLASGFVSSDVSGTKVCPSRHQRKRVQGEVLVTRKVDYFLDKMTQSNAGAARAGCINPLKVGLERMWLAVLWASDEELERPLEDKLKDGRWFQLPHCRVAALVGALALLRVRTPEVMNYAKKIASSDTTIAVSSKVDQLAEEMKASNAKVEELNTVVKKLLDRVNDIEADRK